MTGQGQRNSWRIRPFHLLDSVFVVEEIDDHFGDDLVLCGIVFHVEKSVSDSQRVIEKESIGVVDIVVCDPSGRRLFRQSAGSGMDPPKSHSTSKTQLIIASMSDICRNLSLPRSHDVLAFQIRRFLHWKQVSGQFQTFFDSVNGIKHSWNWVQFTSLSLFLFFLANVSSKWTSWAVVNNSTDSLAALFFDPSEITVQIVMQYVVSGSRPCKTQGFHHKRILGDYTTRWISSFLIDKNRQETRGQSTKAHRVVWSIPTRSSH